MIELITLHIHKTGGRSFYQTLKSVYGDAVDVPRNRGKLFADNNENISLLEIIPDHIKVLYGHLEYRHVTDLAEKYSPKIITWLRDPVERVISHYYYKAWKQSVGKTHDFDKDSTLIEFARKEDHKNLMSHFLKGIDPEELFFTGVLENYNSDLKLLASMLNWKKYRRNVHRNSNANYKKNPDCKTKVVTQEMREEIFSLNQEDVALYNRALELRKKYQSKAGRRFRNFLLPKFS